MATSVGSCSGDFMETVLVAGGVGSRTRLALDQAGSRSFVSDNVSNGHREYVQWGPLEVGDIGDAARLNVVFVAHTEVGVSVRDLDASFDNSVNGSLTLIQATHWAGVNVLMLSSTRPTFRYPLNPYGYSKLIVERVLADYDRYVVFRSLMTRYFNAAWADVNGRIPARRKVETRAIPLTIQVGRGLRLTIFCDDYDTREDTAGCDYIHMRGAEGHVSALRRLSGGHPRALNLATGVGTTVTNWSTAWCGRQAIRSRSRWRSTAPRRRWGHLGRRQRQSRPGAGLGPAARPRRHSLQYLALAPVASEQGPPTTVVKASRLHLNKTSGTAVRPSTQTRILRCA